MIEVTDVTGFFPAQKVGSLVSAVHRQRWIMCIIVLAVPNYTSTSMGDTLSMNLTRLGTSMQLEKKLNLHNQLGWCNDMCISNLSFNMIRIAILCNVCERR